MDANRKMTTPIIDPDRFRSIESPEERAIAIAVAAHQGQRDKAGEPYIYHLLRVMLSVEGSAQKQVALLHDLLEDTPWTAGDLKIAGISQTVIEALELLTHKKTDSYADYVVRLSRNLLAKTSKLADLNDNYRLNRVAFRNGHHEEDSRRIARYILSHDFLTDRISEKEYRERMQAVEDQA
jgi:hypothetical protein